jgi:hypothetical protein
MSQLACSRCLQAHKQRLQGQCGDLTAFHMSFSSPLLFPSFTSLLTGILERHLGVLVEELLGLVEKARERRGIQKGDV